MVKILDKARAIGRLLAALAAVILLPGGPVGMSMPAANAHVPGPPVLSVAAKYGSGKVTFSGEARDDVAAVAVLLQDSSGKLLRMTSIEVDESASFRGSIKVALKAGTYTVQASEYEGGELTETTFKVKAGASSGSGSGSGGSGGSETSTGEEVDTEDEVEEPEVPPTPTPEPTAPTAQPTPTTPAIQEPTTNADDGTLMWIWLVGAAVVVVGGGGLGWLAWARHRRPAG